MDSLLTCPVDGALCNPDQGPLCLVCGSPLPEQLIELEIVIGTDPADEGKAE